MSTDATPSLKHKHSITLTRGAAYLLEGLFQRPEPFTSPSTTVQAAKMWGKLRRENKCVTADGHNFEKAVVRTKDETDIDVARRQVSANEAYEEWKDESVVLELSDKQRDLCREAINWGLKNRDKGALPQNNQHLLSLLEGFGIGLDGTDD